MGIGEAQTMTNNRLTAVPPSLDHLTNTKRNGVAVIVAALHVSHRGRAHAVPEDRGSCWGPPWAELAGAADMTSK